jgi:hypothetical protein
VRAQGDAAVLSPRAKVNEKTNDGKAALVLATDQNNKGVAATIKEWVKNATDQPST